MLLTEKRKTERTVYKNIHINFQAIIVHIHSINILVKTQVCIEQQSFEANAGCTNT